MSTGAVNWDLINKLVTLLFMGIGLLVIPILPGLVIIWAASLGFGYVTGFRHAGLDHVRPHHGLDAGGIHPG